MLTRNNMNGAGGGAAGQSVVSITATGVRTSTVSPSGTLISTIVPAAGDSRVSSTFSASTSASGSSSATVSPTPLSQLVLVPSLMTMPHWGSNTSTLLMVLLPSFSVVAVSLKK